jgi:hypothetical protein
MNARTMRRARAGILARLAKRLEWEPMERKLLTAEETAYFKRIGDFREGWLNNIYSAQVYVRTTPWGQIIHLAVRRHDGGEVQGWDPLQRIKNELIGPDRIAIEIYPSDSLVNDEANMRHLFVMPEGFDLPLTIHGRWT